MKFKLPEQLDEAIEYGFKYFNEKSLTKDQIRTDIETEMKLHEHSENFSIIFDERFKQQL